MNLRLWRSFPLFASTWSLWWVALSVLAFSAAIARGVQGKGGLAPSLFMQSDYETLYAGARCMLQHCDPYNVPVVDSILRERGAYVNEKEWAYQLPVYPPTTLVVITPLAALPYATSLLLWALLDRGVWMLGLLWVFLRSSMLNGVPILVRVSVVVILLASSRINLGLSLGNPAYVVAGLLMFVATDSPGKRPWAHAAMLFFAVALKPQLALPLMVLLFFRSAVNRRAVWLAMIFVVALAAGTLGYAAVFPETVHWRESLSANLVLAENGGGSMDPTRRTLRAGFDSMVHLQYLLGYWIHNADLSRILSLAGAASLALLLAWPLIEQMRFRPAGVQIAWSDDLDITALAAVAVWTLLPVYHRWSDLSMIPMLILWALRFLFRGRMIFRTLLVIIMSMVLIWKTYFSRLNPEAGTGFVFSLKSAAFYRGDATLVLLLAIILIISIWNVAAWSARPPGGGDTAD